MNFLQFDLGSVKAGATVIVTLDKQANVRLMDPSQFANFRAGRRHSFFGGGATLGPQRLDLRDPRRGGRPVRHQRRSDAATAIDPRPG